MNNVLDEVHEGVIIGQTYVKRPLFLRVVVGIPLIYIPILVSAPFILLSVVLVRWHLRCLGASNMKSYWDFVPSWISHRYSYTTQPVSSKNLLAFGHYKPFWLFNCKVYCPMSIALLRYNVYLVKIVENWWCPFAHDRKREYADARIDYSYWHVDDKRKAKLHPDDLNNQIWNKDARG
jgi:hypothetical protein